MNRVLERVLNLLAFLLDVVRPVSADEIRYTVAGYDQETDEAFRRTFERDKDLLRTLGVPLRMEHTDVWEVEQGYIIAPDEYGLEDPGLTDEERAALWMAATMVRLGGGAAGPEAIFKLGGAPAAAGGEPLTADLGAEGALLTSLFEAVSERRRARFTHRGKERSLAPYGLVHKRGRWYVVGETPEGVRAFRIDRIQDLDVRPKTGSFERPKGFSVRDAIPDAPWEVGSEEVEVEVRFDPEAAWWARRQLGRTSQFEESADGALTARFPVAHIDAFVGWLISFDDQAEVLAPEEVRERFVEHVRSA